MARFTLHAVAADQAGIVAAVAESLAEIGCNLQESRMSRLHGQFSIVLVLEAPGVDNGLAIEEALSPLLERIALQYLVRPIDDDIDDDGAGLDSLASISLRGVDHPGTVARVAHLIAAAGGSIVDLVGHVASDGSEAPSHLDVVASIEPSALGGLRAELDALARELSVQCEIDEVATRR